MRDSLTLASLLLTDRDKDNLVSWHESLATAFDREVEDAFRSHSSGDFRAKVIEIGVGLALRAASGFISLLYRNCVSFDQIDKVMPWYREQVEASALEVWFPAATKRFNLSPIRSQDAGIISILGTMPAASCPPAKENASAASQLIESKKWHIQTGLVVRHLEKIALCSVTERQAAICAMAADLFDDFARDRVNLVRSFNDLPDFEAEMKTYGAYVVSPEMLDIQLTEAEIAAKKIMLSARRRDWLAQARLSIEAKGQVERYTTDSAPAIPRKRGFEANTQRHELVSTVVRGFGTDWKRHMPEICAELETAGVDFPLTWRTDLKVRTWGEIADEFFEPGASQKRGLLRKWLAASLKWKLRESESK